MDIAEPKNVGDDMLQDLYSRFLRSCAVCHAKAKCCTRLCLSHTHVFLPGNNFSEIQYFALEPIEDHE